MMASGVTPDQAKGSANAAVALFFITALFFIWAFVTNLIDPLVKSMKVIYSLSDFETQLNQFAFFIAYGVMSIPAAWYLSRKGYANSILLGLAGVVAGCLIAWATSISHSYVTVLLGLFNSIMFPTIFTITLERSSAPASATSGLMCIAICGGGFISLLYGAVVDGFLQAFPVGARSLAYVVPLSCYIYILWFARAARSAPTHAIREGGNADQGGHADIPVRRFGGGAAPFAETGAAA
jgi:fucose permease